MDSLLILLEETSNVSDWFTTDRIIVGLGTIFGPALLWLLKWGIQLLKTTVQSHLSRVDLVLEGIQKSLAELITITKIHEEKHKQHEEDIERLKDHVYPVKYRKP